MICSASEACAYVVTCPAGSGDSPTFLDTSRTSSPRYSSNSISSPKMRGMLPRLISSTMKTHGAPIWAAARQNSTKTPGRAG